MKGLLIKDLKILAKQKKFFMFVLLFTVLITFGSDDVTLSANYVVLIVSMLTLSTMSYDKMNGGMLFLLSLPANRKTYVKEKYVFAFLNLIFASIFASVLGCVASIVKHENVELGSFALNIMVVMFMMGMAIAVAIPLYIKYDEEKGRTIMIMAMAGVLLIATTCYKLLTELFHIDIIGGLGKLFDGMESEAVLNGILIGGLFALLFLILFCSYLIANKIMNKKEF